MRKLFWAGVLFFAISCGSGGNKNNSSDSANTNSVKGNSAGSNIIEMDTLHMDTSGHAILSDSALH